MSLSKFMVFYHNIRKVASRDVGSRVVAADVKKLTMAYFCLFGCG